ncbi:alpha/beta hydrolase-fold protein [Geofilum rubicundum]|uniref:Peptidase S9 prolyl oligopeptidase catalytic domain-containing protein n=1 Tax=Geofilum rubicundum JCM 15548 TaxID=1236989 RepID=A0A0E9LX48_9BACT|nr:alpha/beta hydrolase-fold protein [Geofilum rubicundum]GAO29834.1 hypothetical protein JCM15548_12063 [Geofilum rubicundum JCM 15548]
MMRKLIKVTPLFLAVFFSCYNSVSAQRQGNIVEYFGKEKYEETKEGSIIHVFEEGLVLEHAARSGVLFGSQDMVAWQLANNSFKTPLEGEELASYPGTDAPLKWRAISADTAQVFRDRNLRRGYLYTSFDAPVEEVVLLEATGHTRVYINGMVQEGDHYDFGYTLIPFRLKKGTNQFIYTPGRFGRVAAKLVVPAQEVMLINRDLTLPDIINGEAEEKWGAVRLLNATDKDLKDVKIECVLETGERAVFATDAVMPMAVRKVKFRVPGVKDAFKTGSVKATLILSDGRGRELDRTEIELQQRPATDHHERTFISQIDGSVQYYSVAPSTEVADGQALVLSVHGASVEARNQARAYKKKDWAHIVAPTNRRPFGFNWEEWGRIDAMEVLAEAKKVFKTEDSLTYLTGHSMGGHGTWYLGVTYPDQFAAIAPCASYPDIIGYRRAGNDSILEADRHYSQIKRAANAGRTLSLKRNYLQSGVYILHGDADNVVSVDQARLMRSTLGEFHNNFSYYEYPGGSHWYGDHSVDWFPIFDYFKWHAIPAAKNVQHIEFHTASPAVSAQNYWVRIEQQPRSWDFSNVVFDVKGDSIIGSVENVSVLTLNLSQLNLENDPVVVIDGTSIQGQKGMDLTIENAGDGWQSVSQVKTAEKYSLRHGGFKTAFDNNVVFVYATGGSKEENAWYLNKARFDAETFLYRGNASIDVVSDKAFNAKEYKDRNVIIYGNASNNAAWKKVLRNAPLHVANGEIRFGDEVLKGDDLGTYFVYPRFDSATASVGVVAGTGLKGMKATYANNYFSGITGFPDVMVFSADYLKTGLEDIKISGFFGRDWSIGKGEFSK